MVGPNAYLLTRGPVSFLEVINVSHPANMTQVSLYNLGNAIAITVVGTTAYVAHWSAGLMMLDVSNPGNPLLLSR